LTLGWCCVGIICLCHYDCYIVVCWHALSGLKVAAKQERYKNAGQVFRSAQAENKKT